MVICNQQGSGVAAPQQARELATKVDQDRNQTSSALPANGVADAFSAETSAASLV